MELPFTFQKGEVAGLLAFLISYFRQYEESSIGGGFLVTEMTTHSQEDASTLTVHLSLAPFDHGVTEECHLMVAPEGGIQGIFQVSIDLIRKTGDMTAWRRGNQFLINELRKQFLLWKAVERREIREKRETNMRGDI